MMQQHEQLDGAASVAVNLLWCVPGDVGGSEEYLVRQLLGLAQQASDFVPTLYVVKSFIETHPGLANMYPIVEPMCPRRAVSARGVHDVC